MTSPQEILLTGLAHVESTSALLQRVHRLLPAGGLYQAADVQWWWAVPRSTDDLPQLHWVDEGGDAVAVAALTDFADGTSAVYTDPMLLVAALPDAPTDFWERVLDRALEHATSHGIDRLELEVEQQDARLQHLLTSRGFTPSGDGLVLCRLDPADRPTPQPLAVGDRLVSRAERTGGPHPMNRRAAADFERRLREVSLYRPDLDLAVVDEHDEPAAFALCWFDPTTESGMIEPVRTHDAHQRRGLAHHLLATGIERLVSVGAREISIGYEPDNPASGTLYRRCGFVPRLESQVWSGPTTRAG